MGSRRKLLKNSAMTFVQQMVTLIYGLLIPRLILEKYGSDVNGTIASIAQFISITSLIQGGFSSATRVAYYAPVAKKDNNLISVVNKTSTATFQKFGIVLFNYAIVLGVIYPRFVKIPFDYKQSFVLILVLALNAVFESFFGLSNQLLLFADQKGYINTILIIVCTILNGFVTAILISLDFSIIVVKFCAALIFIIRPLFLNYYVRKHYNLDYSVPKNKKLLSQSKDAFATSIAFYVHSNTDNIVITAIMDIMWVSVYSVHRYVVSNVSNMVALMLSNTEVVFGQLINLEEGKRLKKEIPIYDLLIKLFSTVIFFSCAACINQFVQLYTKNVKDIDYYQPVFSFLMCAAEYVYCSSLTYNNMIMAAGHIKQTKWISIVEAMSNIVISVVLVFKFGIVGVAIGTLVAFMFNTVANYIYMKKHLLDMPVMFVIKEYAVNILAGILAFWAVDAIGIVSNKSFVLFLLSGVVTFLVVSLIVGGADFLFFRDQMRPLLGKAKDIIGKKIANRR